MKRVILFAAVLSVSSFALGAKRGSISKSHGNEVSGPGANQTKSPDGGQTAATPKGEATTKDTPAADQPTTAPAFVAGQSEVQKANAELTAVTAKLRGNFEQTQDYKDAAAEQKQAHADYATANQSIADSLSTNPQYTAAVAARKSAEDKLAAARSETPENVPQLATEAMKARGEVKDLEKKLGGNTEAVSKAKSQLDAADEKVTKLRAAFEASMKTDPDYVAAKTALDTARGIKTASAK